MAKHIQRVAIFPGSFDPVTFGHLDVIERGAGLFDELIVAVGENPEKTNLFTHDERVAMVREVVPDLPNVHVEEFSGLTVDFATKVGACAILRGLRNISDLQHEFQVALTNRVVSGVETVFIMTSSQFAFTSSSLIKQVAQLGGNIGDFHPA